MIGWHPCRPPLPMAEHDAVPVALGLARVVGHTQMDCTSIKAPTNQLNNQQKQKTKKKKKKKKKKKREKKYKNGGAGL